MKFNIFAWINNLRPKPFKWLQKYLDIEQEWSEFKVAMRPHRGKFFLMGGVVLFPVYHPIITHFYEQSLRIVSRNLQKDEPLPKVAESFGKQLISGIFQDQQVQRDSGIFVQDLVKRQIVLDAVLSLLVQSIKSPIFLEETKGFSKTLVIDVLKDEETLKHTLSLLLNVVKDAEFKHEIIETLKFAFSQPEITEVIVELFRNALNDKRVRQALSGAASGTVNDLFMDKETLEKLKFFIYFVLESESTSSNGSVKQIIDQVVENVMKKRIENPKDTEFAKIFEKQPLDEKLSLQERIKDLQKNYQRVVQANLTNSDQNASRLLEVNSQKKRFFFM